MASAVIAKAMAISVLHGRNYAAHSVTVLERWRPMVDCTLILNMIRDQSRDFSCIRLSREDALTLVRVIESKLDAPPIQMTPHEMLMEALPILDGLHERVRYAPNPPPTNIQAIDYSVVDRLREQIRNYLVWSIKDCRQG